MGYGRLKFVIWVKDVDIAFVEIAKMHNYYDWLYSHCAEEICPKTGRLHIDGYYELQTCRKWTTENKKFLKFFGKGYGDLSIAVGSHGENCDYSEKEGRRQQKMGSPVPPNGTKRSLDQAKEAIVDGSKTVDELTLEDPTLFHQYGRTLSRIEDIIFRKRFRTEMTKGIWYWGPTAVGKSHKAFENYHPDTHYLWKLNERAGWQDGYTGQETVILNDFRAEIRYNDMLNLVDKWPYTLPRRGREPAPFLGKTVIVTSSCHPSVVYRNRDAEDSIEQMLRRFEVVELKHNQTVLSYAELNRNFLEGS
jgi:hypothetical protein